MYCIMYLYIKQSTSLWGVFLYLNLTYKKSSESIKIYEKVLLGGTFFMKTKTKEKNERIRDETKSQQNVSLFDMFCIL